MNTSTSRSSEYIKLLLYIMVLVLFIIAGLALLFRMDLTKNIVFFLSNVSKYGVSTNKVSLSEVSKDVVSTLSEPITVKAFFTKDLPAPHNNMEQYLHHMLEAYSLHGNQFFNYSFINVSPETDEISGDDAVGNQKMAIDYGIEPIQLKMIEQDEVKFKRAYMGLVLIHGDIIERIPTITYTEGLEYKLTTAIQRLNNKVSALLDLDEKVQVKLVLSSSLDRVAPYMGLDQLKTYPADIKRVVEELSAENYNQLTFSFIDPTLHPDQAKKIEKLDIMKLSWPAIPDSNIEPGEGIIGMLVQYKDNILVIPVLEVFDLPVIGTKYELAKLNAVEEQINAKVEHLVNINEDIGYLADHGTLSTMNSDSQKGESIGRFSDLLNKSYTFKPLNIKDENIPDGLKCLVIARPTEKLSDYALYQIDQALMRGTNLAIFVDMLKEAPPDGQQASMPSYVPMETGLGKLLSNYGVRIKKSLVLDENCYKQFRSSQQGGGATPIYFAPIIQSQHINKELDYIKNIEGLITFKISPLELDRKRIKAQKIIPHKLLASSDRSWQMRDRITLNPRFINPPGNDMEMSSLPLAYMLEGSFTSYFKGKPMPEKPVEKKEGETEEDTEKTDLSQITEKGAFRDQSPKAKIFVIGSAEVLKDQLMGESDTNSNAIFIMNMIDALNDRGEIAALRSKTQ